MAPAMLMERGQHSGNEAGEVPPFDVVLSFVVVRRTRGIDGSRTTSGFTLVEVIVAIAIIGLVFASVLTSYVSATDRSEWSGYSLAAQALASQGIEQVRAARWEPQTWPVVDELGGTNIIQVEPLDVPASKQTVFATNYITVTTLSLSPPIRELRADCVWMLASRGKANRGPFTNTSVTLRAPDQ